MTEGSLIMEQPEMIHFPADYRFLKMDDRCVSFIYSFRTEESTEIEVRDSSNQSQDSEKENIVLNRIRVEMVEIPMHSRLRKGRDDGLPHARCINR